MNKAMFLTALLMLSISLMFLLFFYIHRLFQAVHLLQKRRESFGIIEQELDYLLDEASFQLALLGALKAEIKDHSPKNNDISYTYDCTDNIQ